MKRKLPSWCEQVHEELKKKGVSVNQLAKEVHMARPYVSNIINGNVRSEEGVRKISGFLNIVPQEFDIV